jgi:hypothetical protein
MSRTSRLYVQRRTPIILFVDLNVISDTPLRFYEIYCAATQLRHRHEVEHVLLVACSMSLTNNHFVIFP